MDGRISMVTLGVDDLARSRAFYQALGLYGRQALAEDAGVENMPPGFPGYSLAINVSSEAEVDQFFELALASGAHARKPPQKPFWGGYSGYFADPDGHLWEVAHNPFFATDARGNLQLLDDPA